MRNNDNGTPGVDVPNYGAEAIMESEANKRQHGGDHYKKMLYEHWDWVHHMNLGYHIGTATKYVSRWRRKNGREDLEKAVHYIDKAIELDIHPVGYHVAFLQRFCDQLEPNDALTIRHLVHGNYEAARTALQWLIDNDAA